MSKSLRVYPTKFHGNFHTFESHENLYNEVFGHAEHESGLIFLITIISISSYLVVVQLHGHPRQVQQYWCCLFFLCTSPQILSRSFFFSLSLHTSKRTQEGAKGIRSFTSSISLSINLVLLYKYTLPHIRFYSLFVYKTNHLTLS